MKRGRIDIHTHLIPGVDDGCETMQQAIDSARMLVRAGFTHAFCTPHVWPNLPHNNAEQIAARTAALQSSLDAAKVGLRVLPGGELNLRPELREMPVDQIVTYALAGKFVLCDLWAGDLPPFFLPVIERLLSLGCTPVLAHPERMEAIQKDPALAKTMREAGVLLQGNLQCLTESAESPARRTMQRLLVEEQYEFLATDLHKPDSLIYRLNGLARAAELVGQAKVDRLTIENPRMLLPKAMSSGC